MATQTLGTIVRIGGVDIGRVEALGDIKFARSTKEYAALNRDELIIAAGKVQAGDIQLKVIMDQADDGAQKALRDAVKNAAPVQFEIELNDKPENGTNGTKFTWNEAIVYDETISPEEDGYLVSTFNVKTPGFPTVTAAA